MAGVLVSKPATGPAGSSRVIIRGVSSLGEDSQPLYVVDGVPIDNSTLGTAGMWGGSDGGDGIGSINPDDIENISVLKGPSAAALYGTRAKNGVVLITTKRATPGLGLGVEFSSNTTFESVLVNTDWQNEYGQGTRGEKPTSADDALSSADQAWGPPTGRFQRGQLGRHQSAVQPGVQRHRQFLQHGPHDHEQPCAYDGDRDEFVAPGLLAFAERRRQPPIPDCPAPRFPCAAGRNSALA